MTLSRYDPTNTITHRKSQNIEVKARHNNLKKDIKDYTKRLRQSIGVEPRLSAQQVQSDIKSIVDRNLANFPQERLKDTIDRISDKGAVRSYDDMHKVEKARSKVQKTIPTKGKGTVVKQRLSLLPTSYNLRRSTYISLLKSKAKYLHQKDMLAEKSAIEWQQILDFISSSTTRTIFEGMRTNIPLEQLNKQIDKDINKSTNKAIAASNEITVRAFTDGQLEGMEDMGVKAVGVQVEWATAGDNRVCPLCQPLEGIVIKIQEARNKLPRHPNCRCAWTPANIGEINKGQKKSPKQVNKAIKKSISKENKKDTESQSWNPKPVRNQEIKTIVTSDDIIYMFKRLYNGNKSKIL